MWGIGEAFRDGCFAGPDAFGSLVCGSMKKIAALKTPEIYRRAPRNFTLFEKNSLPPGACPMSIQGLKKFKVFPKFLLLYGPRCEIISLIGRR